MEGRTTDETNESTNGSNRVETVVSEARSAGDRLADRDASATGRIVEAVAERLADRETISRLAGTAVNETGRGHPGAKLEKIATAVDGARAQLRDAPTVGRIDRDGRGDVMTVVHPVGVVGVTVPATHPVVVPAVTALFALAGRNAVVFAPSPSAVETCDIVVEEIHRALKEVGAPTTAVSMVPAPASKPGTDSLFEQVDLAVGSGSESTVTAGQRCGTPNLCAGADGLVAVSDGSVPTAAVATRVAVGATYDFGAHPASEAAVVAMSPAVDGLIQALEAEGGYRLDDRERDRLRDGLDSGGGGWETPRGNSPRWFTSALELPPDARRAAFLIVEPDDPDDPDDSDDPLATLPGIPAVSIHGADGFGDALALADDLGGSHAAAVHTTRQGRVQRAAERLRPGRLVVNRPGIETAGSRENGFPVAPILGGGVDEGSQLSGGLAPSDLVETTRVSVATTADRPAHLKGAGETLRGP